MTRTASAAHRGSGLDTGKSIECQEGTMSRFLIERNIPGASELTEEQLAEIARKSNAAMQSLGVPYRWITSYVAGDKVYCIHEADDEDAVREHARRGGFPADVVVPVSNEFGPQTATAHT
ncbi:DUF4242 domain-containing protein [Mycobacterium sp. SMC-8]|uniref:DUF4242 domain-containing protein n=1 Tax=Mycobacterium sp. SMC-8 TaxID=2857060 RepID=UPI0021B4D36D|nr:DUF4242 domain-containing protein [Mycobacterium sp. SMC-8]